MPRFFSGDELGAIKSIAYTPGEDESQWRATSTVVVPGNSDRSKIVQKLALHRTETDTLLAAAHGDGSVVVHNIQEDSSVATVHQLSESRMKGGQRFVGLAMREGSIFSCTSNGALRLTQLSPESTEPMSSLASLPMRLCEWRLAQSGQNFAYGGDEVELSIWDTENAFSHKSEVPPSSAESNKRKRGDQLLPGEVWRAKNIPNDHLSLRQPVRNTALTFLQSSSSTAHHDLLVGTASGNVRRYDTRAARRPVADWKAVGKTGGISTVEKGFHDHEVFVADHGCTLSALDVRSGRTIYAYKGISGAVSSVAPAQSFMASTSQDRFVRLHSTFGPPQEVGQQQDHKGDVLDKLYMKVTPTVVVWDDRDAIGLATPDQEEEGGDDVWDTMQAVESDDEDDGRQESRKEKKTRKE